MSAVSSAWGKSHQMLVWRKCQSTCLTFCGPETCSFPLDSPKGTSCQQLLLFILFFSLSFIFQILHHTIPSWQILEKTHDLLQCFCFFVSFFCMCIFASRFVIKSPGCHDNKLGCHAGISPSSYPHVNDHFTAIPIPDFTGNVVNCGK